jgi:hypothetical protein
MVMMVLAHNKYAPLIWMQLLHQQLCEAHEGVGKQSREL